MKKFIQENNYPALLNKDPKVENVIDLMSRNSIPFLPIIDFENADWNSMYKEAKNLSKLYVHHRAGASQGWQSLCIHGLSSVHTDHHPYYGFPDRETAPYRWTDIADWCPTITKFFKQTFDYDQYARIRIMKLCAGGYIHPHQDVEDITEARLGPINIALNNPDECKFYMKDIGYLPFKQGRVIKLNLYNQHCVMNNSDQDRYHLIVHGKAGKSWRERIWNSYLQL